MERIKATPESHARTMEFIEASMVEGAHLRVPTRFLSEKAWNRTVDIGLLFHAGPETTGPLLANMYGVTREDIRQTKNRFIVDLYKNSSKETRQKFPLDSIALGKPAVQSTREKICQGNGGLGLKLKDLIEKEGLTDAGEIVARLGTTRTRLRKIIKSEMYKNWGLNLEVKWACRNFKEVEDKVNQLTSDRELKKYLDGFSDGSLRGYIFRKNTTQTIFGNLGATLKEIGVKNNRFVRPVALKLISDGLPVRLLSGGIIKRGEYEYQKTYFIYFLKQKQKIIEAVKALGTLSKNPEIMSLRKAKKA